MGGGVQWADVNGGLSARALRDGRGPEPHGRAAHGCSVAPARSPGRCAPLRFYSEYPAHNAGVWLPE